MKQKEIENYNEQAYNKWDQEALIPCKNCNRTFLPDRLEIHLRSCTSDKPLKPLPKRPAPQVNVAEEQKLMNREQFKRSNLSP